MYTDNVERGEAMQDLATWKDPNVYYVIVKTYHIYVMTFGE